MGKDKKWKEGGVQRAVASGEWRKVKLSLAERMRMNKASADTAPIGGSVKDWKVKSVLLGIQRKQADTGQIGSLGRPSIREATGQGVKTKVSVSTNMLSVDSTLRVEQKKKKKKKCEASELDGKEAETCHIGGPGRNCCHAQGGT